MQRSVSKYKTCHLRPLPTNRRSINGFIFCVLSRQKQNDSGNTFLVEDVDRLVEVVCDQTFENDYVTYFNQVFIYFKSPHSFFLFVCMNVCICECKTPIFMLYIYLIIFLKMQMYMAVKMILIHLIKLILYLL